MTARPYVERVVQNIAGVLVGFSGVIVLGSHASLHDHALAVAGAALIPLVSRISGAAGRTQATPWFLRWTWCCSIVAAAFAGGIFHLVSCGQGEKVLRAVTDLNYIWVMLGLIADVSLVAAEQESNEPQFKVAVENLWKRLRS